MQRRPSMLLQPFVRLLWTTDDTPIRRASRERMREHALPTGSMHVVIRLDDVRLEVFEPSGTQVRSFGPAVVGGARAGYYVKVAGPFRNVGVQLRPGAARALLGGAACEFSDRHIDLEDVLGREAGDLRERLRLALSAAQRLDLFEAWLLHRLRGAPILHPAVAGALATFEKGGGIAEAVADSGYSQRQFIRLFDEAVGLTPKRYCRVQRFRRLLARIARDPFAGWADLALAAGYSDQPHFAREFREFAGLTPEAYRRAAPISPHHVLQPAHGGLAAGSIPFNTGMRVSG